MGVYDYMMRPSMGHRLQVELRDSMHRYQREKTQLQQSMAQLSHNKRDLHTSPLPPTPPPKRRTKAGSKMNAIKQEEKGNESKPLAESEAAGENTILPPIQTGEQQADTDSPRAEEDASPKASDAKQQQTTGGSGGQKTVSVKAPWNKKATKKKGKKMKKMKKGMQGRIVGLLKLPIIDSASLKDRNMWDSGCNHHHPKGKSTKLEKNQVDEDCRNFRERTFLIPPVFDRKRTEIQLVQRSNQPPEKSKVTFTSRRAALQKQQSVVHSEDQTSASLVQDHFPQKTPRLPELDASSDDDSDSEDEPHKGSSTGQFKLPPLHLAPLTEASTQNSPRSTRTLPRLLRGKTPSAISTGTHRSGATGASTMSQETLEWKGEYMNTDKDHNKTRMLVEILHTVRQRMHDNEEDLRLSGIDPRPQEDRWSKGGRSDVMLVHRNIMPTSGSTTARSSEAQQVIKLPNQRKKLAAPGVSQSPRSKLHRYLNKLSFQRRGLEQQAGNGGEVEAFQLASTTIREITQSSLGHRSTVQTAHTVGTAS